MTIKVNAGDLARAMKHAGQVVEKRNTIPILSNVLFEAGDNRLSIVATDLDLQVRQDIPAVCEGAFAVTIPAQRLTAIATAVSADAQLTFSMQDGHRVAIKAGRSRWVLATLPPTDFPRIPAPKVDQTLTLEPSALAQLINRVVPFCSKEEVRYYLKGPLWHGEDGKVALASTDGHRLMRAVVDVDWPADAPEVILAPKACKLLASFGEEKSDVRFAWGRSRICVSVGRVELVAKVIDGTFPDYRRVIGLKVDAPMRVDPEELRAALSRLLVAGDRPDSAVLIDPTAEGVTLSMKASDALADASEDVACEVGSQPAAAFNARYLQEMLAVIGGDTVEIHMADEKAPTRIVRTIDDGAVGTVMPMRR